MQGTVLLDKRKAIDTHDLTVRERFPQSRFSDLIFR